MYGKRKIPPYLNLVEHYFRLATRLHFAEVRGDVSRKWHQDTVKWLNNCPVDERTLVVDFYKYNQSVRNCTNYRVTNPLYDIAERYACDMGVWSNDEREVE